VKTFFDKEANQTLMRYSACNFSGLNLHLFFHFGQCLMKEVGYVQRFPACEVI
jgi:hypothetical protein